MAVSVAQIRGAGAAPDRLRRIDGIVTASTLFLQPRGANSVRVTASYEWSGETRSFTGYATLTTKRSENPYRVGGPVELYAFSPKDSSEPRLFLQPPPDRRGSWLIVTIFGGLLIIGAYALRQRPRI